MNFYSYKYVYKLLIKVLSYVYSKMSKILSEQMVHLGIWKGLFIYVMLVFSMFLSYQGVYPPSHMSSFIFVL